MELRHLRYFVAVPTAGSLTVAAAQRMHTSQPSLSRRFEILRTRYGARLDHGRARGIELTPAGRSLSRSRPLGCYRRLQRQPKRHAVAHPAKPYVYFTRGFMTGHDYRGAGALRNCATNCLTFGRDDIKSLLAAARDGLSKEKSMKDFFGGKKGAPGWPSVSREGSP